MDILLWIGWSLALIITVFTVWMLTAGALAARSPSWDSALYAAARNELIERGFQRAKFSDADDRFIKEFLGREPNVVDPSMDVRLIDAIGKLTDATGRDFERLNQIRERTLNEALSRQHAIVARISTPWLVIKLWKMRKGISTVQVGALGLRWFIPLYVSRTRKIGERYLTTATLIGVWLGLLYWGFSQLDRQETPVDGLTIVGIVVTLSSSIGLVATAGRQMYAVAVVWWGPRSSWTLKGLLTAFSAATVVSTFLFLTMTGRLQIFAVATSAWLASQTNMSGRPELVGGAMMLVLVAYMIYNGISGAFARHLTMTARVSRASGALFLSAFAAAIVMFILDVSEPFSSPTIYALVAAVLVAVLSSTAASVVEWANEYRSLRQARIHIPRRGFRWWALYSWVAGLLAVSIPTFFMQELTLLSSMSLFGQTMTVTVLVINLSLALTFWPGVVVTALYFRRVSKFARATARSRHVSVTEPLVESRKRQEEPWVVGIES